MCLWVCDNLRMQCSFNLQIKYPLYSAHSSAKGDSNCSGNRLTCGEKPPFRPIWLCDTGFHRLCLNRFIQSNGWDKQSLSVYK